CTEDGPSPIRRPYRRLPRRRRAPRRPPPHPGEVGPCATRPLRSASDNRAARTATRRPESRAPRGRERVCHSLGHLIFREIALQLPRAHLRDVVSPLLPLCRDEV